MMTHHATLRCQQRGLRPADVHTIIAQADIDEPVGNNCRLLQLSRERARQLNLGDKVGRTAVIFSDDSHGVVTVMPLGRSARKPRYWIGARKEGVAK